MATGTLFAYAAVTFFVFVLIGLEEVPIRFNVRRTMRTVRRRARRRNWTHQEAVERISRQTRWGAWVLAGVGIAALAVVARQAIDGADLASTVLGGALTAGTLFLAFAYGYWGPRLLDKVLHELELEAATTNSPPPDWEAPHGRSA